MKKLRLLGILLIVVMLCTCLFTACKKDDPIEEKATYTYNTAMSVFPTNWNPHVYQTQTDATILDYTTTGFYTFDYNDTKDGYKLVPALASAFPVDVTASYLGQYGIPAHVEGEADATGRAYKIALNPNAKFDNGEAITADDYIESLKLLLNPAAANYRADSVYSGNMKIVNAKNYLYQGKTIWIDSHENYSDFANLSETDKAKLRFDLGEDSKSVFAAWADKSYPEYSDKGYPWLVVALGADTTEDAIKALEGKTVAEIWADATLKATWDAIIDMWQTAPDEEFDFFTSEYTYAVLPFEQVGISKDADGNLLLFLENELSGFYLHYALTDTWLVYTKLYKECESITNGVYENTYGTTADKFVGFGPYKLTGFMKDAEIKFTKNEHFFGLKDGDKEYYQTTDINIKYVEQASTRLQMFQKGQLDTYGLQAEDMEDYQSSRYTYYTEGDSIWFLAFNPDMAGLTAAQTTRNATGYTVGGQTKTVNKTIITIKEFRQAFCYALDRAAYALAIDPLGAAAKALYGNMIISDPENGTAYRTTSEAKQVIVNFWGLADDIGDGKTYATIDDAIDAIDGYDPAAAKELFDAAYDKAIADNLMTADDVVLIQIGIPKASSSYYSKGADFLKNCYTEAVKGTKLEGKLFFENSADLGNDFSDFLKKNQVDMLFGVGWTGSALDPYGLIEAYTSDAYQYDPGWDTTKQNIDVKLGDKTYRASVSDWTKALGGEEIDTFEVNGTTVSTTATKFSAGTTVAMSTRLAVLAALEEIVLEQYDMIPISIDSSAALKGMQIKYYTEEYIFGVGRGGIKYMTYNYTDKAWDEYVASQSGGTLNYTVSE